MTTSNFGSYPKDPGPKKASQNLTNSANDVTSLILQKHLSPIVLGPNLDIFKGAFPALIHGSIFYGGFGKFQLGLGGDQSRVEVFRVFLRDPCLKHFSY